MIAEWLMIERLLISAIMGGLIGVERQMHEKPAGLRTHVLVCMGATLFTLLSLSFSSSDASAVDVSRVAAGVVTGIGFLAAGSIFRDKERVRGLTTAADLWVIAAIGLSIGLGYYSVAVVATIVTLLILMIGRVFDNYLNKKATTLEQKNKPPFFS